jgi:phospholipid/cholesterol/gamma-HCH transport system substrate-binding protein
METRANYLLIGAFTVAGFLALLGLVLWFMRVELDRQYAYYDVVFPSVSGLSNASEVRFSGLPVGQVIDVALAPDRSGSVRVRIEVRDGTPVRTSSVASIEALGVTGVSFLGITSGNPDDPLLASVSDDPVPDIPSRPSTLQTLSESAPEIIDEILAISRSMAELLGPVTQDQVRGILDNVESSSANLDQALRDISQATGTMSEAVDDIAGFTAILEPATVAATAALETADTTLQQVSALAVRAETTLDAGDAALASATRTLDGAAAFIASDLPPLADEARQTLAVLRDEAAAASAEAQTALATLREAGTVATDRLRQSEATLAATDTALAHLSDAAASVDALVSGEGAAAVADLRALLADANTVVAAARAIAETDLPTILADVRDAADTAARTVESVGADLSAAAGRADAISAAASATLDTVADTFESANATLARLDTALDTGDAALVAARDAFASADRVLNDDLAAMADALRATLAELETAIGTVSDSVPAIADDLRATAASASATLAEVETTARRLGPPLRVFADDGLPQYARLARESRELVAGLDRLVARIARDPARYFLGRDAPDFR